MYNFQKEFSEHVWKVAILIIQALQCFIKNSDFYSQSHLKMAFNVDNSVISILLTHAYIMFFFNIGNEYYLLFFFCFCSCIYIFFFQSYKPYLRFYLFPMFWNCRENKVNEKIVFEKLYWMSSTLFISFSLNILETFHTIQPIFEIDTYYKLHAIILWAICNHL